MKIILHMGQGKTGTSSLQASLHGAAPRLRQKGAHYPDFGFGFVAHSLLIALCGQERRLPPWRLDRLGGTEGAVQAAERSWTRICAEISVNRPELMILTSEYLADGLEASNRVRLAERLRPLSSDITPVLYVRHPVDHFRARLQQRLKSWDKPFPPQGPRLKEAVLDTEAAFGRAPALVAFDRKTLHAGDIITDFATRFLSPWVQPADLPAVTTNVGLSAEALVLMSRLRIEAGGSYEVSRLVARLVPQLEALDISDPPSRPFTLVPEVAEAALRSATGHRWLAETGRLTIPGLDIDRIDGAPVPDWMLTAAPEALFLHDPDRLARLRQAVQGRKELSRIGSETGRNRPSRGIADRAMRFLRRKLDLVLASQGRTGK